MIARAVARGQAGRPRSPSPCRQSGRCRPACRIGHEIVPVPVPEPVRFSTSNLPALTFVVPPYVLPAVRVSVPARPWRAPRCPTARR